MKLVVVIAQQKNGKIQYIEHEVGYGTALKMVLIDIYRRIQQKIK